MNYAWGWGCVRAEGQAQPVTHQAGRDGLYVPHRLPRTHMASALSSATFTKKVNLVTALCPCIMWCSRRCFGGGTELLPSAHVRISGHAQSLGAEHRASLSCQGGGSLVGICVSMPSWLCPGGLNSSSSDLTPKNRQSTSAQVD